MRISDWSSDVCSSDLRVLIIDCDFSRPQVHKVMRVDNDRGLTDVLAGTVALEDAICHATGSPLSVLPAGQATHSAADLLTPDVMGDLLTQLSASYDLIILDSTPVLSRS